MNCQQCGSPIAVGNAFCGRCGTQVAQVPPPHPDSAAAIWGAPGAARPAHARISRSVGSPNGLCTGLGGAWIFCGYLFGLLGGLLGIAIGAMLIQSKAKDAYGNKVQKCTSGSRWHGFAILLLSSIMFAVVTQMTG